MIVPKTQTKVRANVFRISLEGASHTVSRPEYRRLCKRLEGASFLDVYASDIQAEALRAALTRSLNNRKASRLNTLIVEVLSLTARASVFDRLCSAIDTAESETSTKIDRIVFVVSSREHLQTSVLFTTLLLRLCAKKRIQLLVTSPDIPNLHEAAQDNADAGTVIFRALSPSIAVNYDYVEPEGIVPAGVIDSQEIRERLELLTGHFLLPTSGGDVHVGSVLSVRKLATHLPFVQRVKLDLEELFRGDGYSVVPTGVDQEGLDRLSLAVLQGDSRRVLRPFGASLEGNVAVLCDSIGLHSDFLSLISENGPPTEQLAIVAIAGDIGNAAKALDRAPLLSNRVLTYVDLGSLTDSWPPAQCPMCDQDVQLVPTDGLEGGRSFDTYARAVHKYDSYTFWRMLSTSDEYLEIGHWASDRTRNHYDLRVRAAPVFRDFGWDIARRVRNGLESVGVLPGWIRGILCTEGEESEQLAGRLGDVLGISDVAILRVPRGQLKHVAGKDIGDGLAQWLLEAKAGDRIGGRNVLILDQAAHHFRTYSSLRSIADYLDCATLAFAVFLDRTSVDFDIGDFLHSAHYLPLYSWPAPPRRDCNCKTGGRVVA